MHLVYHNLQVHDLLTLYNEIDVPPKCLLFKIPSTWQGIEASRLLESEGIQTHLTFVYRMDPEKGEKTTKRKYRGMTQKSMITKNRSKGIKLQVKYNLDGIFKGESTVHLTSYLGVLARTMVPIRYQTWHVVPKQLKDKLWDNIENMLTVKYILPFKDQPELLKKPPIQYIFIEDEDWTMFVKDRLSDRFKEYREVQKERRKKHIYNHHLSRKGYAGLEEEMVRKCELAVETKENIVVGGTIILECGPNYLVAVDASYDSSAPLPIPIPGQTTTVGAAIVYQVLWPAHLVIIHTLISTSKKGKKQKENEVEVKSKGEKAQDIKNFEALVSLMLSTSRVHPVDFPDDVFGSKENRSRVIADRLRNAKHAEYMLIPYNPDFHRVLVALEMKRMIAYYLDPMADQPCDDLREIVNIELTWVKVVCPRQPGSVECGYYVMRYMKEIIANPNQLTSKKTYSEMEIDEVRSDWVMLMTQLIITHV
ncbi:hypothetical protein AAG906_037526 [Vitis piasezkii]